jgi:hypothetical protein
MESLSIILTQKVNVITNTLQDIYNVCLCKTTIDGTTKNINMPVELDTADGVFLKSLVSKVWDYIPDAEPDALSQAKARKLQEINSQWTALEKSGWDSGQGFSLGITASDVALLVGVFSLAKEAAAMGLAIPSIIAMNNSVVNFETISEMTILLLRYGAARSQMSEDFAAKRRAVESATTVEELELIQ